MTCAALQRFPARGKTVRRRSKPAFINDKNMRKCIFVIALVAISALAEQSRAQKLYHEPYRLQVHFSPREKWMNDPNGMVYHQGVYHLFYQYYPDSIVWGPNHWGHATSKDMIRWEHQPVALHPDSLGLMASGSAVVDKNNTSGFGKGGRPPLVAIFTHIDLAAKDKNNNQYQSIAYSLDDGKTWTKYARNPVVKNPGITDFRDPKVMWYEPRKKWIMTVAAKDRVMFYSAPDLKNWTKESDFGKELGAHGGVWECPDLFTLDDNGKKVWVLVASVNPGGPNGGSGTQYFLGDFDGHAFTPLDARTRWLGYGPDEYAGVTWSGTGDRKVLLGWMSNWKYAEVVPASTWRSSMTIPRDLKLRRVGNDILVASQPVAELNKIAFKSTVAENVQVAGSLDLARKTGKLVLPARLDLSLEELKNFSLVLSNGAGEEVVIGYDQGQNQYFIDRTKSGNVDFHQAFAAKHAAPRLTKAPQANISLLIDVSSVELFADDGLSVMTETFFPNQPYDQIHLRTPDSLVIKKMALSRFNSIWPQ